MAEILIVESNYDVDMLMQGNYPPLLKTRIMQNKGHLSNEQAASAIKRLYHNDLTHIFLCHLSENNNTPELAYKACFNSLKEINVKVGEDVELSCLPRRTVSELFTF